MSDLQPSSWSFAWISLISKSQGDWNRQGGGTKVSESIKEEEGINEEYFSAIVEGVKVHKYYTYDNVTEI